MADTVNYNSEPKPPFSLLMAALAQVTLVLGFSWSALALFGAGHLLTQVPPAAALGAAAASFACLQLLLRNRRPLLVLLAADVVLAALSVWSLCRIFGLEEAAAAAGLGAGWCTAVRVLLCGGILLALFSQLKWTAGKFDDGTMMLQLQILLLSGAMQIWMADQLELEPGWAAATFLMAAGLLAGQVAAKTSGLHGGTGGRKNGLSAFLGRSGPVAAALAFCGLAVGSAVAFAEPVGQAVSRGYDMAEGLITGIMMLVAKVLRFLFLRNRTRVDEDMSYSGSTGTGDMEYVPVEEHNLDIFRILFHIICIALILIVVVALVRLLLQVTIGKGISLARKRSSRTVQDGTFREQIQAMVRELRQRFHAWSLLRRNPSSIAAMIVWLERETGRSEELRRRPGETLRVFLLRLADGSEDAAASALRALADEADLACYSRDGRLMADFAGGGILREYFAKKL